MGHAIRVNALQSLLWRMGSVAKWVAVSFAHPSSTTSLPFPLRPRVGRADGSDSSILIMMQELIHTLRCQV